MQLFKGTNEKEGTRVENQADKELRYRQEKTMRIIMRIKCKTLNCKEQRRNGSAWCQVCSDRHKFEALKFTKTIIKVKDNPKD